MSPAADLRAAAKVLRDTARNAVHNGRDRYTASRTKESRSPVVVDDTEQPTVLIETFARRLEDVNEWLALMSPAVAEPLADWLEGEADTWPPSPVHASTEPAIRRRRAALTLARSILGRTQ